MTTGCSTTSDAASSLAARTRNRRHRVARSHLGAMTCHPRQVRALIIGKRAALLSRLKEALDGLGVDSVLSQDLGKLPEADAADLSQFGAVVFGRAVPRHSRLAMIETLTAANPDIIEVQGMAPMTELLVAQVQQALDQRPTRDRFIVDLHYLDNQLSMVLAAPANVEVIVLRLDVMYRTHRDVVFGERLNAGRHTVDIDPLYARAKESFIIVRAADDVTVVPLQQRRSSGAKAR